MRAFRYAVQNHYWYQMYLDDLPIWGQVGDIGEKSGRGGDKDAYIFAHKRLEIGYNGNRIVDVNLFCEEPVSLVAGEAVKFSYSVTFKPSTVPFEKRFDKYLDRAFFQHHVRALATRRNCVLPWRG